MENIEAGVVDFGQFRLEPHVEQALEVAQVLARDAGAPVNAVDCLVAAVNVSRFAKSKAFSTVAELWQLPDPGDVPRTDKTSLQISIVPALAQSLEVARDYLDGQIWGRDFVTLALLNYDPALESLAESEGIDLFKVRDRWFDFVVSTDMRRPREQWEAWWRGANFTPPVPEVAADVDAYMLTWNPSQYPEYQLQEYAKAVAAEGVVEMSWSSGNRKKLPQGSRVYLLRQGDNAGIVGSGVTVAPPSSQPHWKSSEAKQGRKSLIVPVRWDRLSTEPLLAVDALVASTGEERLWRSQSGGVLIPVEVARKIAAAFGDTTLPTPDDAAARFAKTLSDLDHSNDWIGIRPDVEALSTLMAVNRLEPPLSIAIFGDWGSGKTFLMRKIQERVMLLEKFGRQQMEANPREEQGKDGEKRQARYCSSILQIEFNAWHYTESNLWASLLNYIFEKLQEKLNRESKTVDEKERQKNVEALFQQFETARAARAESEALVERIGAETTAAGTAVGVAEGNVSAAQKALGQALGLNAWSAVDEALREPGSKAADDLKTALKHFGFKDSLESAQALYGTMLQFRSVSGRAREVLGSMVATRQGLIGAGLVVAAVALAVLLSEPLHVTGLTLSTALATGLSWVIERAASARKWLDKIQAADAWLTSTKEAEDTRISKEVETARLGYDHCQNALGEAQRQLHEAQTREATARADLEGATARDQMRRFVDTRIADRTYAKHLGLVSMIRRDFEDLSDFMYRDRQAGEARLVQRVARVTNLEEIPTVERIILYIDDLDRCQPERVVEVLEAVHLLMAFRLFVVVVAVDPRWVFESLMTRYPHLASAEPGTGGDSVRPGSGIEQASTHDYIEKIFHIPFWVKPMTPNACKDLVAGYFDFKREAQRHDREEDEQDDTGQVIDSREKEEERYHEHKEMRTARESAVTEQLDTSQGSVAGQDSKAREEERHTAERAIRNVSISAEEQDFIEKLAPHLGNSPRRIKRFANVYRLLKSGLAQEEIKSFARKDGSGVDYQVVLTFLAVVTGAPTLAPMVLANAYRHRNDFDVTTLTEGLDLIKVSDADEITNARGALALLRGIRFQARTVELWAPRVMRYGFNLTPIDVTDDA